MRQKDISFISIACTANNFLLFFHSRSPFAPRFVLRIHLSHFEPYFSPYRTRSARTRENCPEFMPNFRNMRSTSSWQIAVCIWDVVKNDVEIFF